jgi:serine/threonine-protein kinase
MRIPPAPQVAIPHGAGLGGSQAGLGIAGAVARAATTPASGNFSISGTNVASDRAKICPKCLGRYPVEFNVCPREGTPLEAASDDGDPLLGAVLGGTYQVKRVLGEGGMGKVYEAGHLRLGARRFAVKVLHAEYARHGDVLGRFQREAEAAASIAHSHVLEVFDVARTDDGRPYIVAEFLEGEDFHEYLERLGKLDVASSVAIARQVAGALKAAHDAGIVHRDLKPENVFVLEHRALVGRRGVPFVKLLDFGISKISGRETNLTRTGMIMGTPNYMAPEQARGEKVDHRVDVYALGAILYRMLTGKRAFEGTDASAVMAAVLSGEPRRPRSLEPSIPEAVEVIVQKAMAKDARDRYQDMEELDRDLAVFDVAGVPSVPPPAVTLTPNGQQGDFSARTQLGSAQPAAAVEIATRPAERRREQLDKLEAKGRDAKIARPTIVLLTPVVAAWLLVVIVGGAAGVIREVGRREVTASEVMLMTIFSGAAFLFPLIFWISHVAKNVWRNSVRAIEMASDIRRFLGGSLIAYGAAAVAVRFAYTVPMRLSVFVASGWWDVAFLIAALLGGAFGGGIGPLARLRRRLLNA